MLQTREFIFRKTFVIAIIICYVFACIVMSSLVGLRVYHTKTAYMYRIL